MAASQVWRWVSTKPGTTTSPLTSMTSASAGRSLPTAAILSPSMRTSPFVMSPSAGSMVMTYPPRSSTRSAIAIASSVACPSAPSRCLSLAPLPLAPRQLTAGPVQLSHLYSVASRGHPRGPYSITVRLSRVTEQGHAPPAALPYEDGQGSSSPSGAPQDGRWSHLLGALQQPPRRLVGSLARLAPQRPSEQDRYRSPGQRPYHICPPVLPVAANDHRPERASRVHGRPRHRGGPQPGQRDVARDGERRVGADVACPRGGPKDHAHQAGGEDELDHGGLPPGGVAAGQGRTQVADVAEHAPEERRRQQAARKLGGHVSRHPPPGEMAPQREGDAHGWVQVGPADGAHEVDDGHDHERGRHHLGVERDLAVAPRVNHWCSRSHEDQQERPERLRQQAPPLVGQVLEVVGPGCLQADRFTQVQGYRPVLLGGGWHGCLPRAVGEARDVLTLGDNRH